MTLEIKEDGNEVIGIFDGRLDTLASVEMARQMEPLMDKADKHIILDCEKLEFISSSGLRLLLSLRKQSIAKEGVVSLKNMSEEIKSVFSMTGFFSLFDVI